MTSSCAICCIGVGVRYLRDVTGQCDVECGDRKVESGSASRGGQVCGKGCHVLQPDNWVFSGKSKRKRSLSRRKEALNICGAVGENNGVK